MSLALTPTIATLLIIEMMAGNPESYIIDRFINKSCINIESSLKFYETKKKNRTVTNFPLTFSSREYSSVNMHEGIFSREFTSEKILFL